MNAWERLEDALSYASAQHRHQLDKAGRPFILHPFGVAMRLSHDPVLATIGALHDVMEDCGVGPGTLRRRYGADVARAVTTLTRLHGEPYMEYIERCCADELARKVKMADIADNMARLSNLPAFEHQRLHEKYTPALKRLSQTQEAARD